MTTAAEHFLYLREARVGQQATLMHVWVPSESIGFLPLERPTAPRNKWPKLLPWMLEEQLLVDPASQHLVVAETEGTAGITVLAVDREQLRIWCDHCHRLGWRPQSMAPDVLALPWQAGQISVLVDGERVLVRLNQWQGFAGDPQWVWSVLRTSAKGKTMVFYADGPADIPADLLTGHKLLPLAKVWSGNVPVAAHTINLLQGEFKAQAPARPWRQSWLAPTVASVFALLCYLVWLVLDTSQLQRQSTEVMAAIQADFNSLYGQPLAGDGSDLRDEVNFQVQLQERNQQVLAGSTWNLFQSLDPLLSRCGDCGLKNINADSNGLLLQFTGAGALQLVPGLQLIPGLKVQREQLADGVLQLTVLRGETP